MVHQMARSFRDKWIPRIRKSSYARKRKSRCDQPADPFLLHEQNENKLEGRSPTNASKGKPQKRFISLLPVAYGIPFSVIFWDLGRCKGNSLIAGLLLQGYPFARFHHYLDTPVGVTMRRVDILAGLQ